MRVPIWFELTDRQASAIAEMRNETDLPRAIAACGEELIRDYLDELDADEPEPVRELPPPRARRKKARTRR